ncbi:hypothetical protein ACLOJK_011531 [Asimina triloba]
MELNLLVLISFNSKLPFTTAAILPGFIFWVSSANSSTRARRMAHISLFNFLVMLFASAPASTIVTSLKDDFAQCERTVKNWAALSFDDRVETCYSFSMFLELEDVPITIGNFLRKLYTGDQECPRSYDKLRFDPRSGFMCSKPNCRLMVTHDDYSMVSKLPKERTSVVTILRNPVDRIFSTYEFSVEVAARFLVHPNLTSATKMERQPHPKSLGVSTLDIWPWKYLVPWMRMDLFSRVPNSLNYATFLHETLDLVGYNMEESFLETVIKLSKKREHRKIRRAFESEKIRNPYDLKDIAMPLHEFIHDPIAHDIIHNGATFQGLFGLREKGRKRDRKVESGKG